MGMTMEWMEQGHARRGIARNFKLFMRCEGCRAESVQILNVPDADGAPRDVDDLLCSSLLQRQMFVCRVCQGNIAALTGVTMMQPEACM
jgi:hypothetical protein